MKIKEVEALVGIKKTNIRFYEREGLLNPERSEENNYREYSEEDVQRLMHIKALRMLDVPTADIRLLLDEKINMEEVMQRRLESIEREETALKEMKQLCQTIIVKKLDLESMNDKMFEDAPKVWQIRLQEILEHDMVNEVITRKQVNLHLTVSLVYGYFINAIVAFLVGDFFLTYERTIDPTTIKDGIFQYRTFPVIGLATYIFAVVVIVCIVALYMTSSVKAHLIIFHISAIITTPVIIEFTRVYTDAGYVKGPHVQLLERFTGGQIAGFWMLLIGYVVLLYLVNLVWQKLFLKRWYVIPVAVIISFLFTYLAYANTGEWLIPLTGFLVMTHVIGISWAGALKDRETYNRYYAVIVASRIMNVMGCALINQGRGSGGGRTGVK